MKKVAIIDFNMGNIFSVHHACSSIGLKPIVTSDIKIILQADAAILPGVGAFGLAMQNIVELKLVEAIRTFIGTGKPFMGICLGFQLLFSESSEFGVFNGLDCIKGKVLRFPNYHKGIVMKVPFVGWNKVHISNGSKEIWQNTPLGGIQSGTYMYFVHSYYVKPEDANDILSVTEYEGFEYCSSIMHKNIFATQFHPEKSGIDGIKVYEKWATTI
jgi:glutamine amidotransferase